MQYVLWLSLLALINARLSAESQMKSKLEIRTKHNMTFTEIDKLKALAIVNIFETSRPFGEYAACVVLNDGAGVSYGINQFTHRSGSLLAVVAKYLRNGGRVGNEALTNALPTLKRSTTAAINRLALDEGFKNALRAAAVTREMKEAQRQIAFENYLRPALDICSARGFVSPLALVVVYDSVTHGSWDRLAALTGNTNISEKVWITEYVRKRHFWLTNIPRLKATNYRTRFFLEQIAIGNWTLKLPVTVHGIRLTDVMFKTPADVGVTAAAPAPQPPFDPYHPQVPTESIPPENKVQPPNTPSSRQNADIATRASEIMGSLGERLDRVENGVAAVMARRDAAKSLWTTVIGTMWQAGWAVFGFVLGLPKEVWIVVAVIAGALMLAYLYRQITLGTIRETMSEPQTEHRL